MLLIDINDRKNIFIDHFINSKRYAEISNDLNIHRNTISKICKAQAKKMAELNISISDIDLSKHLDLIVSDGKPTYPLKVDSSIRKQIEDIYKSSCLNGTKISIANLYRTSDLYSKVSYSYFYSVIREISNS